ARLDAAVLILVAGPIELERAHMPRRPGHERGAVACAAAGGVPIPGLGEVAAPCQEDGRPRRAEADEDVGGAVAVDVARVASAADRRDGPAPDREAARGTGIALGARDRQAIRLERVGRDGGTR